MDSIRGTRKLICSSLASGNLLERFEIHFQDWTWHLSRQTANGCTSGTVPFAVAMQYIEKCPRESWEHIGEIKFCQCFSEPTILFHSKKVRFHVKGWKLIHFESYNSHPDMFGECTYLNMSFVLQMESTYVEIEQSWHCGAGVPLEPTICKLTPQKVALRLESDGMVLPDELKSFSQFTDLTPISLDALDEKVDGDFHSCEFDEIVSSTDDQPPHSYSAGEDGLRRDAKIYELAEKGWKNLDISKEVAQLASTERWEPIGEAYIVKCLERYCKFTKKPLLQRLGGRPKSMGKNPTNPAQ